MKHLVLQRQLPVCRVGTAHQFSACFGGQCPPYRNIAVRLCLAAVIFCTSGCSDSSKDVASSDLVVSAEELAEATPATDPNKSASANDQSSIASMARDDEDEFAPLSLGPSTAAKTGSSTSQTAGANAEQQIDDVITALKPLQVMLGKWSGKTRLDFDGFKAVDQHEWIWDLQSDPDQPALKVTSDASPYLKDARLTWDLQKSLFRLTATDKAGVTREYEGTYTEPVHEITGPDEKPHKVFRLELTQTKASQSAVDGPHFQFAFAQQENNRYLLEVGRRRGKAAFRRYDTVSTQREGTSFAISDSDYGDKTCIISQGLGTMSVSHNGKSYWVCCSGCKAAFEADPETWIARAEKRAESM